MKALYYWILLLFGYKTIRVQGKFYKLPLTAKEITFCEICGILRKERESPDCDSCVMNMKGELKDETT